MKSKIITLSLASTLALFTTPSYAQQQSSSISDASDVFIAISEILESTQSHVLEALSHQSISAKQTKSDLHSGIDNSKNTIKNTSGLAEIALAKHLNKIGAKMYGVFWCPHCTTQKELFGQEAFANITYIECDPRGTKPRPDLCKKAGVKAYPYWEIKGQKYLGVHSLNELANFSRYPDQRNFKN